MEVLVLLGCFEGVINDGGMRKVHLIMMVLLLLGGLRDRLRFIVVLLFFLN